MRTAACATARPSGRPWAFVATVMPSACWQFLGPGGPIHTSAHDAALRVGPDTLALGSRDPCRAPRQPDPGRSKGSSETSAPAIGRLLGAPLPTRLGPTNRLAALAPRPHTKRQQARGATPRGDRPSVAVAAPHQPPCRTTLPERKFRQKVSNIRPRHTTLGYPSNRTLAAPARGRDRRGRHAK